MTDLNVGDPAPPFNLESSGGGTVTLDDLRGRRTVLYFYPADDTSGCTKEACSFRDLWGSLKAQGVEVFGVSPDSIASHERFAGKYNLPFPLLSDPDHSVAEAYGAWGEKSIFGKTSIGILRSTFLIGPDGTIEHVWRRVKPENHAQEVLEAAG